MGHNELLIGEALRGRPREGYRLSVKFGAQRGPDGAWLGYDASPPAVKTALAYTLNRLGVEHIDVYRPARLDSKVPIEETIGAIAELVDAGYVRHIGLSEVGAETVRRAAATHPISDLQIEYSLISRGIEEEILPTCRELGIARHRLRRPQSRAHQRALRGRPRAGRQRLPRPRAALRQGEPRAQPRPRRGAARDRRRQGHHRGPGGDRLGPQPRGRHRPARRRPHPRAPGRGPRRARRATWIADDVAALERAVPPDAAAGDRYPQAQMAVLDSERG